MPKPKKTLKEAMADIGKRGTIRIQAPRGIVVDVEVLDYKVSYGQERWLVKPIAGGGECWIEDITIH